MYLRETSGFSNTVSKVTLDFNIRLNSCHDRSRQFRLLQVKIISSATKQGFSFLDRYE